MVAVLPNYTFIADNGAGIRSHNTVLKVKWILFKFKSFLSHTVIVKKNRICTQIL